MFAVSDAFRRVQGGQPTTGVSVFKRTGDCLTERKERLLLRIQCGRKGLLLNDQMERTRL